MEFSKLFWRVFGIVLLIIIAWWVLKMVLHVAAWIVYAAVIALVIAGVLFVYNRLKNR